jgi:hypothetical protein
MLIKQTWSLIKNKNCIGHINNCLHYKWYETRMIVILCLLFILFISCYVETYNYVFRNYESDCINNK